MYIPMLVVVVAGAAFILMIITTVLALCAWGGAHLELEELRQSTLFARIDLHAQKVHAPHRQHGRLPAAAD